MRVRTLFGLLCATALAYSSSIPTLHRKDADGPTFKTESGASSCEKHDVNALAREVKTMYETAIDKIDIASRTLVRSTKENRAITEGAGLIFGLKIEEKKLPTSKRIVYPDGKDILDKLREYYNVALELLMKNGIEVRCGGKDWKWKKPDPDDLPEGVSACDEGYWWNERYQRHALLSQTSRDNVGREPEVDEDPCSYNPGIRAVVMRGFVVICDKTWTYPKTLAEARETLENKPDGTKIDTVLTQSSIILHEIMHLSDHSIKDKTFTYADHKFAAYGIERVRQLKSFNPSEVFHNADSFTMYALLLNLIPLVGGHGEREREG